MGTMIDIMEKYQIAANKAYKLFYEETNDSNQKHIERIGASVMMTRDKVLSGGSFAQAVINNDLADAVGRADSTCINHLKFFVYCKKYVTV